MPDLPGCWIQSERGIRCLQTQELAKGKGVPGDWFKNGPGGSSSLLKDAAVRSSTGIHIWTAALDDTLEWLNSKEAGCPKDQTQQQPTSPESKQDPKEPSRATETYQQDSKKSNPTSEPDKFTEGKEWTWEAPDLQPGSD
jgi:hypothetical protein